MDTSDIAQFVPHTGPMRWLDRIAGYGDGWLEAEATIRPDGPLGDRTGLGAWTGIEYMAQTVATYAGLRARMCDEPVKIGLLVGTRRYESRWSLFPVGSRLLVRVTHDYSADNGLSIFDCRIICGEVEVATAALSVFQPANLEAFLRGEDG
jgi:predicted hotdog family 3-hydroxylacyl-ACP dehydratase